MTVKTISSISALALLIFCGINAYAQKDVPKIKLGGYVDTYIATDGAQLDGHESTLTREFSVVNGKKGQFDLNIAQLTATIEWKDFVRGKATIHSGTLPGQSHNWNPIQEGYAGIQAFEGLWIDAGFFLTHIGSESLLPKDNWLSSHSMVTFFEPFFQAGLRATYTSGPFEGQFHILNGNNMYPDNNDNKTFGWFFGYDFTDKFNVSYAAIIGNEEDAADPSKTLFHNNICFYGKFTDNLEVKGQVDYASKSDAVIDNGEEKSGTFLGLAVQSRYMFTKKISATGRISYVTNEDMIFEPGFDNCMGITLGAEYKPWEFYYIRIEGRMLSFDDDHEMFWDGEEQSASRMELMLNMGIWMD